MPESPILEAVKKVVIDTLREEGQPLIDEAVEKALDQQISTAVAAEIHKHFTGKESPSDGRKRRPRCDGCGKAMRKDGDGWECRKCGPKE